MINSLSRGVPDLLSRAPLSEFLKRAQTPVIFDDPTNRFPSPAGYRLCSARINQHVFGIHTFPRISAEIVAPEPNAGPAMTKSKGSSSAVVANQIHIL